MVYNFMQLLFSLSLTFFLDNADRFSFAAFNFTYCSHHSLFPKQLSVIYKKTLHCVPKVCAPQKKSAQIMNIQQNAFIQKPVFCPCILITALSLLGIECTKIFRTEGSMLPHSCTALAPSCFMVVGSGRWKTQLFRIPQQFSIGLRSGEFCGSAESQEAYQNTTAELYEQYVRGHHLVHLGACILHACWTSSELWQCWISFFWWEYEVALSNVLEIIRSIDGDALGYNMRLRQPWRWHCPPDHAMSAELDLFRGWHFHTIVNVDAVFLAVRSWK